MLIKVFKNGRGRGAGPVGYLIAREVVAYSDNRDALRDAAGTAVMVTRDPLPEVLRGDPARTEALIDATSHQWTYRSGVLAFTREDAPTERQQVEVMDAFERLAFAGLEHDQWDMLWVAAAIEVVATLYEGPERNLVTAMDMLLSAGVEERLQAWMDEPERFGRRPAQAAAALLAAGENERGAVFTTIKKAFEFARSDEMRAFLSRSTASFDDLLDDKIDVFIAVPLDQLGAQAVFMRLLINIVLGTVVRQDGRRVARKRILMVLDEFIRLGRMEKLLDIANVAAGSGIEAVFVTQDKGQIEAVYGKSDTDSLLGSCVTSRIFGLGRLESNTAEWAASALGDQTVITRSVQAPSLCPFERQALGAAPTSVPCAEPPGEQTFGLAG